MTVKELREFKRDVMALWKSKPDYTWKDLQEFCKETGHAETLSYLEKEHWISVNLDETKVFIPWNTNRYYSNITIKNLEQKLIEEELKDNEDYINLSKRQKELETELEDVSTKINLLKMSLGLI